MLCGPKTSSLSPSSGIETVASSANVEVRALWVGPENNGAGGRGLLGLPPYLDEDVPGLGDPLISAGSYEAIDGGLPRSEPARDGVQDRVGDARAENGSYAVSGGRIGAPSTIEVDRELEDMTVGWYDLRGVLGLF